MHVHRSGLTAPGSRVDDRDHADDASQEEARGRNGKQLRDLYRISQELPRGQARALKNHSNEVDVKGLWL